MHQWVQADNRTENRLTKEVEVFQQFEEVESKRQDEETRRWEERMEVARRKREELKEKEQIKRSQVESQLQKQRERTMELFLKRKVVSGDDDEQPRTPKKTKVCAVR